MDSRLIIETADAGHSVPCNVHGAPPVGKFELVFTTAMSAYVESCTDPSYADQALTFAHPVIGAHSWPTAAEQSQCIQPALIIMASPTDELTREIVARGGCAVTCHDVRSIVMLARDGALAHVDGHAGKCITPSARPALNEQHNGRADGVIIVDFGCKAAVVRELQRRKLAVTSVPAERAALEIASCSGIILSNGAGDPRNDALGSHIAAAAIASGKPTLGICYGHQLLAIADGLDVKRLRCGHRGTNHPIVDVTTGRASVTSHNHGFTVSEPAAGGATVTYRSALDGTVEGIRRDQFCGVQFHPEGAPGPRLDEVMDSFAMAVNKARRCT